MTHKNYASKTEQTVHFMIDYYATGLIYSYLGLKEAGGKSFQKVKAVKTNNMLPSIQSWISWVTVL